MTGEFSHEKRIIELEKKVHTHDERFTNIHTKIDNNKDQLQKDIDRISMTLDDIKKGQKSQDLVNERMTYTLDTLNEERQKEEENKKQIQKESRADVRKVKYWSLGMIGTIITSLIIAALRLWIGI